MMNKPCPFCGRQPSTDIEVVNQQNGKYLLVVDIACALCGVHRVSSAVTPRDVESFSDTVERTINRAWKSWDTRWDD